MGYDEYDDEEYDYGDDGGDVGVLDPDNEPPEQPPPSFDDLAPGIDPFADFTGTDPDSGLVFENGEVVGLDLGDGTWADLDGTIYDANGNAVGTIEAPSADSPGFWDNVGNFFKNLFGGNGSGGAPGGAGGAMGSLAGKAQSAAQRLQQAQQRGASPAELQALQRQLYIAQQALNRVQGGGGNIEATLIVAGLVGLGAFILSRQRN